MQIRYSFAVVALMVACGGTSTKESVKGAGDDGGSSGDSSGTSGAGGSKGGAGTTTSKGGTGTTSKGGTGTTSKGGTSGAGQGGDLAIAGVGDIGAQPGTGGDFAHPGSGGDFGGLPSGGGVAGTIGPSFGEVCSADGCFPGDPTVMPIEPSGPIHCGGKACASGEACCMVSGTCFDPATNADACPRPPGDADPQGRRTCSSSAQCDRLFFCQVDYDQLCGAVGHCQPISNCGGCFGGADSSVCRICGCDGNTYPDIQTACQAGTAVAYQGAGCGETVQEGGNAGSAGAGGGGGSAGSGGSGGSPPRVVTPCGTNDDCKIAGESCCAITNRCYPKDDPGQCVEPPKGTRFPCTSNAQCYDYEICAGDGCGTPGGCVQRNSGQCGVIFAPVCGCDGVSYTSADCATQSGARVKAEDACPKP